MKKVVAPFLLSIFLLGCDSGRKAATESTATADLAETTILEQPYRPVYHFSPPEGWMGDPSGLVYYEDAYHLYYWGHATSKDLVHWDHHPKAFAQNDDYGHMSGSVVVDQENTSGFGTKDNPPFIAIYSMLRFSDTRQMQGIAYSTDKGMTWTEYAQNPVLDIGSTEFRDPQVFWYEQERKWVMVIALAGERKVQFYSSPNLKEWTFLSDFGPVGAEGGVWECPDIFELPVDGDPANRKWVLEVDVQPVGGQYFVGSFDGTTFTLDEAMAKQLATAPYMPPGKVLFDFENGLRGWHIEGDAFAASPAKGALDRQSVILGYKGKHLINSFHQGDKTTGKITSPEFTLDKPYLNFLLGGGNHPEETAINLLVDGRQIRAQTGRNTETMAWFSWDVAELKGKKARLEIVDTHTGGFGHVNVDHVLLSEEPARQEREKAFWIDHGPDFYAVRSWQDAPENRNGRTWIAWMGNWLYAHDVPTKPWKGMQSFPRSLALKTFPEGVRLVQQPIESLKKLRGAHVSQQSIKVAGITPLTFQPGRNAYELDVVFDLATAQEVGVQVAVGKEARTVIGYKPSEQKLYLDRTQSGNVSFSTAFLMVSEAKVVPRNNQIRLRILVDQSSVEVFANEGETVISSLIFPGPDDLGVQLFSEGGTATALRVDAWELESIWKNGAATTASKQKHITQ